MSGLDDWFEDEGLDDLLDLLRIGGRVVDFKQEKALRRDQAKVAKYNRQLDMLRLAFRRQSYDYDKRIAKATSALSLNEAINADREAGLRLMEKDLYDVQRGYAQWTTEADLRQIDLVRAREIDTRFGQLGVRQAEQFGQTGVLAEQRRLIDTERREQRVIERAEMRTLEEREEGTGVARVSASARLRAGRGSVAATRTRMGTESAFEAARADVALAQRVEQASEEIGAAAASGAARGMYGSYRRTEAMRAQMELDRDLRVMDLEAGLTQLRIAEEGSRTDAAAVDVERRYAEEVSRIGIEGAGIREQQARVAATGRIERGRLGVRGAEHTRLAGIHAATGRALSAEEQELMGRRALLGDERERVRREGAIATAGYSLKRSEAQLGQWRADVSAAKHRIASDEQKYQVWLGTTAQQINQWQLKNIPELPDYDTMGTRSAMSALINTFAEVLD